MMESRCLKKSIEKFVEDHKRQMTRDLQELVKISSVPEPPTKGAPFGKGNAKVLEKALELCRRERLETCNFENYCGRALWNQGGREVSLVSHLDTVPVGDGWSVDPFGGEIKQDYVIGRGSRDNKSAMIAGLYAIKGLKDLNVPLKNSISLIMGCNEENGMADIEYYLQHHSSPDLAIVTDCDFPVCYGEKGIIVGKLSMPRPSCILKLYAGDADNVIPAKARAEVYLEEQPDVGKNVAITRKSETHFILEANGIQGHAAFPESAHNAIGILFQELTDVCPLTAKEKIAFDLMLKTAASSDGRAFNIWCEDDISGSLTCSSCILRVEDNKIFMICNIRYPVTKDGEQILKNMEESACAHGCAFQLISHSKPYCLSQEDPVIQKLYQIYKSCTGSDKLPYVMGGGTYARKFPRALGFGMGDPLERSPFPFGRGGGHQPDEGQSIELLAQAVKIYILALCEIDKDL